MRLGRKKGEMKGLVDLIDVKDLMEYKGRIIENERELCKFFIGLFIIFLVVIVGILISLVIVGLWIFSEERNVSNIVSFCALIGLLACISITIFLER